MTTPLVDCDGQQPNATKCSNDRKQYYFSANSFKQIASNYKDIKKT